MILDMLSPLLIYRAGGILSQGLRIAPPEAPVNGYAFGKGVYLADISTKSANYCVSSSSGNTGLLLLCEAELGNPMYELLTGDSGAKEAAEKAGARHVRHRTHDAAGLGRRWRCHHQGAEGHHDSGSW